MRESKRGAESCIIISSLSLSPSRLYESGSRLLEINFERFTSAVQVVILVLKQ